MIKPSRNWKFNVSFIAVILGIVLIDLLFSRVLLVDYFINNEYVFQNHIIIIAILSFISTIIISHFELRFKKAPIGDYITAWIFGTLTIVCISGIVIWILWVFWNGHL